MPTERVGEPHPRREATDRDGSSRAADLSGDPSRPQRIVRWAALLFVIDGLVLIVLLAAGISSTVAQALLVPLLLVWAVAPLPDGRVLPARVAIPLVLALACSAVGDTLPAFLVSGDGDVGADISLPESTAAFMTRIGAFALAQISWAVVALPWRRHSILRPGVRPLVLAYGAAAVVVLVLAAPGAGLLVFAMIPYALIVTTAAVLATGLGPAGGLGSVLFMLSGAMFGIFKFAPLLDPGEPVHSISIMAAYMGAQAMLILAVRRALSVDGWPVPPPAPALRPERRSRR